MTGRTNASSGGGGLNINGVIEQYKVAAGGNISAGDFVQFVKAVELGGSSVGENTQISDLRGSGNIFSAVALSEDRAFIVHNGNPLSGTSYPYGVVVSLVNGIITLGETVQLSALLMSGASLSAVKITEDKVLVLHSGNAVLSHTSSRPFGVVLSVSGTAITMGTETQLSTKTYSGNNLSAVVLSETRVLVLHSGDNIPHNAASRPYCSVLSISGTAITVGTEIQFDTRAYSGRDLSATALSEDKVFVATYATYSSNSYLITRVLSISGTTVTAGNDTIIYASSLSKSLMGCLALSDERVLVLCTVGNMSAAALVSVSGTTTALQTEKALPGASPLAMLLPDGKVLVLCIVGIHEESQISQNYYPHGVLCSVSDTAISHGEPVRLSKVKYKSRLSAAMLSEGKVFVLQNSDGASVLPYGVVLSVNGDSIAVGTEIEISSLDALNGGIFAMALSEDRVLVLHSVGSDNQLYGTVFLDGSMIATHVSLAVGDTANGVAKTPGSDGDTIDVYIPA